VWGDFVEGLRYVAARPAFVFLSLFLAATLFGSAFVYALSGPLVLGLGDEAAIGLVYAAFGIGSVAGALALGAWGGPPRRIPAILAASAVVGAATVLSGLRADLLWIGACMVLVGGAQSIMLALHRVVFQEHAAPAVQGRVFAFRTLLATGAQAAGILVSGRLAAQVFEPAMAEGGFLAAGSAPGSAWARAAARPSSSWRSASASWP
jgi:MFS transporter, DHA3 family, macrolide efflux protein